MHILFQYPTRGRPELFKSIIQQYLSFIQDKSNFTIQVLCDEDDSSMNNETIRKFISTLPNTKVHYGPRTSKVNVFNQHIQENEFDILIGIADDMFPQVVGFDNVIREEYRKQCPDLDGVLFLFDGNQPSLCTIPVMGKPYYQRFGYVIYPGYKAFYGDDEYTYVAKMLGKYFVVPGMLIKHEHPSFGGKVPDDILYRENQNHWAADEQLYIQRKQNTFGLTKVQTALGITYEYRA